MLISPEYLELQRELHSRGNYGVSAPRWAMAVNDAVRQFRCESVLDYGCGKGLLRERLAGGYEIFEYDPAIPEYETRPTPADLVFCGDVLEHIEPPCLEDVLDDLRSLARKLVILTIATRPAKKILADGRNAHLIVEPAHWWMLRLAERWQTLSFGGSAGEFCFVGVSLSKGDSNA